MPPPASPCREIHASNFSPSSPTALFIVFSHPVMAIIKALRAGRSTFPLSGASVIFSAHPGRPESCQGAAWSLVLYFKLFERNSRYR